MIENDKKPIYCSVEIRARSASTEIWLGDDEGHFVQTEVGTRHSRLIPGKYTVEFGLGGTCYPIHLNNNATFTQFQLEAGPSCPRPVPDIPLNESGEN